MSKLALPDFVKKPVTRNGVLTAAGVGVSLFLLKLPLLVTVGVGAVGGWFTYKAWKSGK